MTPWHTEAELRRELERRSRDGAAALARELGVSRQMLHNVLKGGVPIGQAIPRALGYEPVTVYARKGG